MPPKAYYRPTPTYGDGQEEKRSSRGNGQRRGSRKKPSPAINEYSRLIKKSVHAPDNRNEKVIRSNVEKCASAEKKVRNRATKSITSSSKPQTRNHEQSETHSNQRWKRPRSPAPSNSIQEIRRATGLALKTPKPQYVPRSKMPHAASEGEDNTTGEPSKTMKAIQILTNALTIDLKKGDEAERERASVVAATIVAKLTDEFGDNAWMTREFKNKVLLLRGTFQSEEALRKWLRSDTTNFDLNHLLNMTSFQLISYARSLRNK